jgi:hypothetical protein
VAQKFLINKADLDDPRYGLYGFENKTGSGGSPYLLIFTSDRATRKNSYPHITIYYEKLKEKTKTDYKPGAGGTMVMSQGQYFHVRMDEYHYSRDSSGKYGRVYKDGTWKRKDMGANIGLGDATAICEKFEKLLDAVINKGRETDSTWGDDEPDNQKFPNAKLDPVFEAKGGPINEDAADVPESWDM